MPRPARIPDALDDVFSVRRAREEGVGRGRLRGRDLERPFKGVRRIRVAEREPEDAAASARTETTELVRAYAARMRPDEFFSHETAVVIWQGPVPARSALRTLQVGVHDNAPLPRAAGVHGRRLRSGMTHVTTHPSGVRVSSPASTWAMLGAWSVPDLVALGDHFCRQWRSGHGRPNAGRAPLATREDLAAALAAGRRVGADRLREALALVRCDSWSPRESACRVLLIRHGLPEPALNHDVRDERGVFVACVDLAYPRARVAVEYHGAQHHETYAADVERVERLRTAGWEVIQVTSALFARPDVLVARVAAALRRRGGLT